MVHCPPGNSCVQDSFSWLADDLLHWVRKSWLQLAGDRWTLLPWPFIAPGFPAGWKHLSWMPAWGIQCSSCNTPHFQLKHQTLRDFWQQAVSFSCIWCCCEGMWKYVPTYLFTCTKATENGKCVLNHHQGNNKELMLTEHCILHVISPHWYNQVGFIAQMPALACDRTNRSPANIRYCHGKRVLLARAQGNECSMVSTALAEAKFWRLRSMQAKVK